MNSEIEGTSKIGVQSYQQVIQINWGVALKKIKTVFSSFHLPSGEHFCILNTVLMIIFTIIFWGKYNFINIDPQMSMIY